MTIVNRLLNKFAELVGIVTTKPDNNINPNIEENGLMVTADDFKKLIQESYIQQPDHKSHRSLEYYFLNMFGETYNETATKIQDAKKLKKIFPELNGVESLLASSILSPTNFLNFNINFSIDDPNLTEDQKTNVIKRISDFFNDELQLPNKLHEWLIDIIGTTGSKPVLVLPHVALQKLKKSDILNVATENAHDTFDIIASNKIYDTCNQDQTFVVDDELYVSIATAFESIHEIHENVPNTKLKPFNDISNQLNNEIINYFKSKNVSENIQFVEDPSILLLSKQSIAMSAKKANTELNDYLTETSNIQYKTKSFIDLSAYINTDEDSYPIIIELPSEAVIPIAIPGNLSEHIGYIVLLDQFGNPLTAQKNLNQQMTHYVKKHDYLIQKLYTTMYKNTSNYGSISAFQNTHTNVLKEIYEKYLDYLVTSNLSNIGFQNITLSFTNTALSTIFTRILAGKKTRMLFIPEEFLTYFAISFNDKGIGESKTEEVKFIASLRMTYIITRLFSQMQSSVNSRRLQITFDKNIPNPLELAKKMKQSIINERIFDFSYEPTNILKTLLDREISIVPRSLPGIENFSVEDEPNQRGINRPDEDLIEQLNNMSLNGLEIPPSVFNQLRESEFSRSVLTNNIFYGLKIAQYQEKIIAQLSKFIRIYLKYYTKLQKLLIEDLTPDEDKQNVSINKFIASITASLPPFKLGFDMNAGKMLDDYSSTLNNVVDQIFPNEIVPDDLRDSYEMYKGFFKSSLMKKFLQKIGMFDELNIDSAMNMDMEESGNFIRQLQNFGKGINDLSKIINIE